MIQFCLSRIVFLAIIVFALFPANSEAQEPSAKKEPLTFQDLISTPEQIAEDFKEVQCKNKERLEAVRQLFLKMGVAETDLTIEKHKDVENVVIRLNKNAASEEKIIVGAHYDKAAEGCGAVDNWTGVVIVAHLYKTLKQVALQKNIVFVAFGREEEGLVGARAMVKQISKEQLRQYCAMINLDSFSTGIPQSLHNVSNQKLEKFAAELAKEMSLPFGNAGIDAASADSAAFLEKKIPAITLHGMTNGWEKLIHSSNDKADKINPTSVYFGYRLALAMIIRIGEKDCGAFR